MLRDFHPPDLLPVSLSTPLSPNLRIASSGSWRSPRALGVPPNLAVGHPKLARSLALVVGSDAAILKRRKQPAPDANCLSPGEPSASPRGSRLLRACVHPKFPRLVNGFFFQTARERISILNSKNNLNPAAVASSAWRRSAQTVNNASLFPPLACRGREREKLLALRHTGRGRVQPGAPTWETTI